MVDLEKVAQIERYQQLFLVHSFLYYKLNESIISDEQYDQWCRVLLNLQRSHPDEARVSRYWELCKDLDDSCSGFYISQYPEEIQEIALRVLYIHKGKPEPFDEFIARYGFMIVGRRTTDE